MTGCANGGSCVYNAENQTYSCVCKKPWAGDKCEVRKYQYCCTKARILPLFICELKINL